MLPSKTVLNIKKLFNELNLKEDAVVVVSLSEYIPKGDIKEILETFIAEFEKGTFCLVGDCNFNTVQSNLDELSDFTEAERRNIFTSKDIKILSLLDDMRMSAHPSLEVAVVGKHADFLSRHKSLDFPYGNESLFKDLYDLDAVMITVGSHKKYYPLKLSKAGQSEVVKRNVCLYKNQPISYLDIDFDFDKSKEIYESNAHQAEDVYGIAYRTIIDLLKEKL